LDGHPAPPVAANEERLHAPARPHDVHPVHRHTDAPTAYAGLLFLLPVLARLGLADWLEGPADGSFARRVLHHALVRLRAPPEDAIWALVLPLAQAVEPLRRAAPGRWADPLLAARPAGTAAGTTPPSALAACTTADQQAAVWLGLARRWLRRAGRIGLATLVRRPGRLSLTATHADLVFDLNDTDIRIRRLGLDVDPGWLPWFGRVVGFHYERPAR
jgi:hypothetical protein